jgi:dTMP kinase
MAARFITFEGIEGVGKTTQVALATAWLDERGISHIVTREPGGTPLAEKIRDLVLAPREENLPPTAELLLMFAARAVHLENRILPALAAGSWVLCDRFTDATFAYQGAGRGIAPSSIAQLEILVQGARQPDMTFLLDLPVELGIRRVHQRGLHPDRFELERVEFFERVRQGYLFRARAASKRFVVIDASEPADAVHAKIAASLQALIEA